MCPLPEFHSRAALLLVVRSVTCRISGEKQPNRSAHSWTHFLNEMVRWGCQADGLGASGISDGDSQRVKPRKKQRMTPLTSFRACTLRMGRSWSLGNQLLGFPTSSSISGGLLCKLTSPLATRIAKLSGEPSNRSVTATLAHNLASQPSHKRATA